MLTAFACWLLSQFCNHIVHVQVAYQEKKRTNTSKRPRIRDEYNRSNRHEYQQYNNQHVDEQLVNLTEHHYGFPFVVVDDTHVTQEVKSCQIEATNSSHTGVS